MAPKQSHEPPNEEQKYWPAENAWEQSLLPYPHCEPDAITRVEPPNIAKAGANTLDHDMTEAPNHSLQCDSAPSTHRYLTRSRAGLRGNDTKKNMFDNTLQLELPTRIRSKAPQKNTAKAAAKTNAFSSLVSLPVFCERKVYSNNLLRHSVLKTPREPASKSDRPNLQLIQPKSSSRSKGEIPSTSSKKRKLLNCLWSRNLSMIALLVPSATLEALDPRMVAGCDTLRFWFRCGWHEHCRLLAERLFGKELVGCGGICFPLQHFLFCSFVKSNKTNIIRNLHREWGRAKTVIQFRYYEACVFLCD